MRFRVKIEDQGGVRPKGNHFAGMRPKGNHSAGMRNGKYVNFYKFFSFIDWLGRSPSLIILIE